MKSYNNDPELKANCIVALHDAVIQGKLNRKCSGTWSNDGHCTPMGALIKDYFSYTLAPERVGFPQWFAYLVDALFRGMNKRDGEKWVHQLLVAIPTGASLERLFIPIADVFFIRKDDIKRASSRRGSFPNEMAIEAYLFCLDQPSSYWKKRANAVLEIING